MLSSKFAVFSAKYKLATRIRSLLENWPECEISNNSSYDSFVALPLVSFAVLEHYKKAECSDVTIQKVPKIAVFTTEKYTRKGAFMLSLYGKVSIEDELPQKAFEIRGNFGLPQGKVMSLRVGAPKDDGLVAAYYVCYSDNEDDVTAEIDHKSIPLTTPYGKYKVQVPYITNIRPLVEGAEIVLRKTWTVAAAAPIKRQVMVGNAKRQVMVGNASAAASQKKSKTA